MLSIILMIVFAVLGVAAVATGKLKISNKKVVTGVAARLLGLVLLTPLPIIAAISAVYVISAAPADPEKFADDNRLAFAGIEIGTLIVVALIVFGTGAAIGRPPEKVRKREDEEDHEGDDRPRRRKRRDEDDDDE
jgi:stringent starvation protein B